MGLRERRLSADAREMERFSGQDGPVVLIRREGDPPERYTLEYRVESLAVQEGEVVPRHQHRVEIFLTLAYPRQAPQCRMLTPVFHPNIAPHAISIGDHWTAGESLAALCIRIAEMLTFQSYNVKSPLNGEAAQWAEKNIARLPLEKTDFWKRLAGDAARAAEQAVRPPAPPPVLEVPPLPRALIVPEQPVAPLAPPVIRPAPPGEAPARIIPAAPAARAPEVTCPRCSAALSVSQVASHPWARCPLCGTMVPLR